MEKTNVNVQAELREQIKKLIANNVISAYKFSKLSAVSIQTVKNFIEGKTVVEETLVKMVNAYNKLIQDNSKAKNENNKKEVKDVYVEVINAIVNSPVFADAIKTLIETRVILSTKDLSQNAASACSSIVNRSLNQVSKTVSSVILGV